MTPQQFEIKVREFNDWLKSNLTKDATVGGALIMAASINKRVENTGKNAKGIPFSPYSTKTTLVGRKSFTGKVAWDKVYKQSIGKDAPLKWITTANGYRLIVLPGGYKAIRDYEGRNTAFKTFSRTREMWSNFGVKQQTRTSVFLGGKNKPSQDKINWNTAREKQVIIYPSDSEIQKLGDYVTAAIEKKLDQLLK